MLFDENNLEITAKTLAGLEDVLSAEIEKLGGRDISLHSRAVTFFGNTELLYRVNLHVRTALKFLIALKKFQVRNDKQFYEQCLDIEWESFITPNMTIAVDSTVNSPHFNHANYVALKLKDAVVDRLRDYYGGRPDVDVNNPDIRLNVYISGEDCVISLDSSGNSLHKRGYRVTQTDAPLNEVLAAGMILLSGWNAETDLYDPMCGSGTIVTEAYMFAAGIPPGNFRKFSFMNWKNYNEALWTRIKNESKAFIIEPQVKISCADISSKAISVTFRNLEEIGIEKKIDVRRRDFIKAKPELENTTLIMNPPYGERMDDEDVEAFHKQIGDKLKQDYKGNVAWVLSGNMAALKMFGLRHAKQFMLMNATIECRFRKFELYEGSRKSKYNTDTE